MNYLASASRRLRSFPILRSGIFILVLGFCTGNLHAQLVALTESYNVPRVIDGTAQSIYFNFSSSGLSSSNSIFDVNFTLSFAKTADLADDPPFYSEMAFLLRKLDTTFSILTEVSLIDLGSFSDGEFGASFNGTITFDDDAASFVNADPDNLSSGVFKPVEPLAAVGQAFSPFWELRIVDASQQNPTFFRSASLSLLVAAAVPEPSTYALLGAAFLLALAVRGRRGRNR
jgi:hypothetical protein